MLEKQDRQKQLAVRIAENATPNQHHALQTLVVKLLDLRQSDLSAYEKGRAAISATIKSKAIWPVLKIIAFETKKHGWDKRTAAQRLGLSAAAVGVAMFGGVNAGIAALGGAVGVPLWVVLGGGAMFARYLFEELQRSQKVESGVTYSVLDGERVEPPKE
ncbi:hypothetical protein LB533_16210 [Mesorhizobium sp. BR1-1-13]|uniref:hypothetical protein n=1 Tax=Mesorhizobium sp. BR1-1-13 TaxID=2876656 RepID=UPI001CD0FA16|nr:hypothetical protein [Mesorhizobium sp. BR1-1-13]MBZ9942636.1 hypothetical protein [Mesorhizobium sp. BR1-1-13]